MEHFKFRSGFLFLAQVCFLSLQLIGQEIPTDAFILGTNLSGLFDWSTELPFVDLMKNAREWYSKDSGNPNDPWNSEQVSKLKFRPDGYPEEIPQRIPNLAYPQEVATIWAVTDGWPSGTYTVLYDGDGQITFRGSIQNVRQTGPGRMLFDLLQPKGGQVELRIRRSVKQNPIRNIRVLMPGFESSYQKQPFNPRWLRLVKAFHLVRFMDWGQTNNWSQVKPWDWENTAPVEWANRAKMDYYTWATPKGIPYEMMIKLMNDHDLDGWVCIPHLASNSYAEEMGRYFAQNLKSNRKLIIEYSNETWNWMFGQTNWLNKRGNQVTPWPERIVPFIQGALESFTRGFGGSSSRLIRVVGLQTGWLDVSKRVVRSMKPWSFDAIAPAWYFGLSEQADAELDRLGSRATVQDVARLVRESWNNEKNWILAVRETIARPLKIPMIFYEGGQHVTAHPFGEEPSYADALLKIQRSQLMFDLYREWLVWLAGLRNSGEPLLTIVHFTLVNALSARFGSFGLMETLDQDLSKIPAPKWEALKPLMKKVLEP